MRTEWADDEPGGRRRWILITAAVLPWVVLLALLRSGPARPDPASPPPAPVPGDVSGGPFDDPFGDDGRGDGADGAGLAGGAAGADLAGGVGLAGGGGSPAPLGADAAGTVPPGLVVADPASTDLVFSSGARLIPGTAEAAAIGALVAHRHLGGPDRYPTAVFVEGVDHPGPGAVIVTVVAVVLLDDYTRAVIERVAVPLRFDARGAAPAGTPYPLRPPALDAAPLVAGDAADDLVTAEAAAAIAAAGYRDVAISSLTRSDAWPWIATVTATAPGADAPTEHVLWLRRHLAGLVVAGTRPSEEQP